MRDSSGFIIGFDNAFTYWVISAGDILQVQFDNFHVNRCSTELS